MEVKTKMPHKPTRRRNKPNNNPKVEAVIDRLEQMAMQACKETMIDAKAITTHKMRIGDAGPASRLSTGLQEPPGIVSGLRPTEETGTNPKDQYGLAKVPFSVIPSAALVFLALGMKTGAKKYGPHNWRVAKVQGRIYLEAAFRHLLALMDGEDFDPATGVHHGAFIMATVAIYLDAMVNNGLIDNRVLPGRTGELISLFNESPGETRSPDEMMQMFQDFLEAPHETKNRLNPKVPL
jgi:hypothetical protein